MNFLEQPVSEWYAYQGYYVRENVRVSPRDRGGYKGELDVVAFHPETGELVHVETSMDAPPLSQLPDSFAPSYAWGKAKAQSEASMNEEPDRSSAAGLWKTSDKSEAVAVERVKQQLKPFRGPLTRCYEAGVQVATLPASNHGAPHLSLSALFLKRTLTDLRSVWLLLIRGYTSQAASVAAALFEHGLAATVLAGDPDAASAVEEAQGDVPWSASALCKRAARVSQVSSEDADSANDWERAAWEAYAGYKYLCKIKHPTLRSTVHDTGASKVKANGEKFSVVSVPDVRREDLPQKALILLMSISRVYQAVRQFHSAIEVEEDRPEYADFLSRVESIVEETKEAAKAVGSAPLPFSVADDPMLLKWREELEADVGS